jgi:hypothetical protein
MPALPSKVLAAYWPSWPPAPALSAISPGYNTVFLFAATPVGGPPGSTGAVEWSQSAESASQFKVDLQAFRASGRCAILTVGGAGSYIELNTTARANAFIASVQAVYAQLGGFDGIDFDIEDGLVYPAQLVYIAQTLKADADGGSFAVTYAPAPWSSADRAAVRAMSAAGVLDMASPQFYDLSGLTTDASKAANVVSSITSDWLPQVGGDASKLGLGYGIASVADGETMTLPGFAGAWSALSKTYPALRGVFCWNAEGDAEQGWAFETTMAPLIESSPVPPPAAYTVKPGDTWASIATASNVTLGSLMAANPPTAGQVVKL